jgi:large subunit ribosomal protein L17
MACSLFLHKRINTTVAKAKALRVFVEPLITKSKNDTTHSRRVVFGYLNDKNAVTELFREVAPKVGERAGGYTRIIKTGNRMGDNADMCMMELVDFNELYTSDSKSTTGKKKSRRSRRGGGKGSATSEATTETAKTEAPKKEESKAKADDTSKETKEAPKKEESPKAETKKTEAAPKKESKPAEKKEDKGDDKADKKD